MKKLELKLDLDDDKAKHKALKRVSALSGIDYIGMDMKGKQLTVIGTVDPVSVVSKLRKYWNADIITVGPVKEPEEEEPKKEEPKAEEAKKEEPKKEEPKEEPKEEEPKKEEPKKEEPEKDEKKKEVGEQPDQVMELVQAYRAYNPQMTRYYYVQSVEENANTCTLS